MDAKTTKAMELLKQQNTQSLIAAFESTEGIHDDVMPTVRGWIMDELERRDGIAFADWLESNDSSPRKYFLQ